MAYERNRNTPDSQELISWIVILVLLSTLWPIGLILLVRKLLGMKRQPDRRQEYGASRRTEPSRQAPGTQGMRGAGQGRPIDLNRGRGLIVGGAVLAAIFGIALTGLPAAVLAIGFWQGLASMSPVIGLFCGGLAMIWAGTRRSRQARRFRKYLALIGRRESVSIATLAQAMPASLRRACDDLQDMLDQGILEAGYLDMSTGRLILSSEGITDPPEAAKEPPEEGEEPLDMSDDDAVLREIRRLNDDIDDEAMSRKIDRIGEITGRIYAVQRQNPAPAGQLRSFLNYYLPTTLKILRAYARMEEQGVEGENIRTAKERIEGMMDKVVEGFEKQLDKLFRDDAMDIATDVEVLERMLEKDGLSGGSGMTLNG